MNKNKRESLSMSTAKQKQRFSIRKLTVGAASVLLGTTFLFGANSTVQADTSKAVQTESTNTKTTDDNANKTTVGKENVVAADAKTKNNATGTDKAEKHEEDKKDAVNTDSVKSNLEKSANDRETSSGQTLKDQNNESATLKLNKDEKAVNENALKESKVANTVDTNKEQTEDTNKNLDEIHATANFVNYRTNKTIKSVELTAKKGQTLYDALGTDVYDYILKTDYPSYVLLPSDEYKEKVNFHGFTGTNYFNDSKLAEEFDQWQKEYKDGKHPLMGYMPFERDPYDPINNDLFAGRIILEDDKTYDIPLQGPTRSPRINVYVLLSSTPAQRLVNYNKYLGEGKEEQLAYHIENGQIYYPLDNSGNVPAGVYESYDNHGQIPNEISTRTIDKTGLVSQTGMIKENQFTAAVVYPEETEAKRQAAEEAGKLAGKWTTLDSLIPEIPFVDENDDNSYETNTDNVVKKGDTPGQPAEQNIMYYANREFKVIFKDITYGDGDKAIELKDYDYTDPKQMTMAANSKENPHNGATNDHYAEYKLSADPYNNRLDDLRNDGYAIVSTEVNLDQGHTYSVDKFNKDNLYNEDGTIKPKTYVVKVLRGVKEITPTAQAIRKVYYKANSKDGQTLKDPVTQEVTLKASEGTYYVDATLKDTDPNAKKLVHIKQATDINGTKVNVVDSENKAPIDTSWVIDDTKTLHDVDDQFNFEKPTGDEAPDTIGEWIHKPNLDINNQADRYTPVNGENKTLDPVYLIYKQKQGQSGPELSYDKPQGNIGISGPEVSFDKPKGQIGVSGPELSFDKPEGHIGVSGPELKYDKPEGHIGVSGPELKYDKPEGHIGVSGPELKYDKPEGHIGVSGPELKYDKPEGHIGVSGPELKYDKPEGHIGVSGPELNYDKPEGHISVSGPELSYDKPKFNIGVSGPRTSFDKPTFKIIKSDKTDNGEVSDRNNEDIDIPKHQEEQDKSSQHKESIGSHNDESYALEYDKGLGKIEDSQGKHQEDHKGSFEISPEVHETTKPTKANAEVDNHIKSEDANEVSEPVAKLLNDKSTHMDQTVSVTGSATKSDELPQTSSEQNKLSIVGLAIAAVASFLGLGASKKKRD